MFSVKKPHTPRYHFKVLGQGSFFISKLVFLGSKVIKGFLTAILIAFSQTLSRQLRSACILSIVFIEVIWLLTAPSAFANSNSNSCNLTNSALHSQALNALNKYGYSLKDIGVNDSAKFDATFRYGGSECRFRMRLDGNYNRESSRTLHYNLNINGKVDKTIDIRTRFSRPFRVASGLNTNDMTKVDIQNFDECYYLIRGNSNLSGGETYNNSHATMYCVKDEYILTYAFSFDNNIDSEHPNNSYQILSTLAEKIGSDLPDSNQRVGSDSNNGTSSNGNDRPDSDETKLPTPTTTAATAAAIAAILIAAGVAIQIANSIAAALAQAVQAGVELTAEEINEAIAKGLKETAALPPDEGPTPSPEPKGPPLYDKEGQPFERNDQGEYWAPDDKGNWGWMGERDAREASAALRKELSDREREIQHHDQQTDGVQEKWRSDTQERHAAERAQERAQKEKQRQNDEERLSNDETPSIEAAVEAIPGIDNTAIGWGINMAKGFLGGSVNDGIELIIETPGAIGGAIASAAIAAAKLLGDPENWRIAGETVSETFKDINAPLDGDLGRTWKVIKNVGDGGLAVGKIAAHLGEKAWEDPPGAAVAISKAVLGADNWEKAIDPDVPVTERMARAIWGVIDTGGVLASGGATVLKGAGKLGGLVRIADTSGDFIKGAKGLDTVVDSAKAAKAAGRVTEAVGAAKGADGIGDFAKSAEAVSEAAKGAKAADTAGDLAGASKLADHGVDLAKSGDAAGDAAKGTRSVTSAKSSGRETIDEMRQRLANQRKGPVNTPEGAAARRKGIPDMATDPEGYVRELPSGALVDRNLANGTGYSGHQIDDMANFAQKEKVVVGARSTNVDSMRHIRDGNAVPKPLEIKSKTISEADTYLGAKTEDKGLVGYFRPKEPDPNKVPADMWKKVNERYNDRLKDYAENRDSVTKLVTEGKVVEREGKLHAVLRKADGSTELKPYAGDIDGVYFKEPGPNGKIIPPGERYEELKAAWRGDTTKGGPDYWKKSGAPGQHGVESNLVSDVAGNHKPGTPEYNKALETHATLAANHWKDGGETVLQMGPDGHLRRGIRFTEKAPLPDMTTVI